MEKQHVFRASAFAILLTLLLLPGIAHAQVTVSCPPTTGGTYTSITGALNAVGQIGPITFTVTGTCNENVSLNDARSLTFVSGAGGAKIIQPTDSNTFDISLSQDITLQNLEIVGVPGSTLDLAGGGVNISEASDVHIIGCDIHDSEGGGVSVNTNSTLFLHNTTIHNNTPGDGLGVLDNSTAYVRGSTIQSNGCAGVGVTCGDGVFVARNSVAVFRQETNLIKNNGGIGIDAVSLSTVIFNGAPTIIQGHGIRGINVGGGSHLTINSPVTIQGNGVACRPGFPCGGIFGSENSTLDLRAGTISGNQGAGIFVQQGTNLNLRGGVTVSNNSGDGIHIRWISIGDFTPIPGSGSANNTLTGNGGASVFCDARSLAIGNLKGFSNVTCGEN